MQQNTYCTRFAEVLQAQKKSNDIADVIDPEHGLAARWRDVTLSEYVYFMCMSISERAPDSL
jgi:hypothetical protein